MHDRQSSSVFRASVSSDGEQGNWASVVPSIDGDGSVVAFESHASNLVSGDTNGWRDVFVHETGASGSQPEPVPFTWKVPPQLQLLVDTDDDGVDDVPADFESHPDAPNETGVLYLDDDDALDPGPNGWSITLDACAEDGTAEYDEYAWTLRLDGQFVDGEVGSPCTVTFEDRLDEDVDYETELIVHDDGQTLPAYVETVRVTDHRIVSLGDSVASGEGNPDEPDPGAFGEPRWQNRFCNRSVWAGPAQAAQRLEDDDPHSSVTFIHLACTGAKVDEGLLGPQTVEDDGPVPDDAEERTYGPQVQRLSDLVEARDIDLALLSIGGNDIGFGWIAEQCARPGDCHEERNVPLVVSQKLLELPHRYAEADACLTGDTVQEQTHCHDVTRVYAGHAIDALGLDPARIVLTDYFDPLRGDNGDFCPNGTILSDSPWSAGLTRDETVWIYDNVVVPLNQAMADNHRFGWSVVSGMAERFATHGYCASDGNRWIRTWDESKDMQNEKEGTLRPTKPGHVSYSQAITDRAKQVLNELD